MDRFVTYRISARFACVSQPCKANNLKTTQIFFPMYSRVIHCLSLQISVHSQPLHDLGAGGVGPADRLWPGQVQRRLRLLALQKCRDRSARVYKDVPLCSDYAPKIKTGALEEIQDGILECQGGTTLVLKDNVGSCVEVPTAILGVYKMHDAVAHVSVYVRAVLLRSHVDESTH